MTDSLRYQTAHDLERAITARLAQAAMASPYDHNELRRQFSYDRLLARIFSSGSQAWILKGGGGLLARIPDKARHSVDVDLYYRGALDAAVSQLQELGADESFGDFFTFDIEPKSTPTGNEGLSLRVVAYLGDRVFQRFSIDLVVASNMTQPPDNVAPPALVAIEGLPRSDYRVYALVDHIADKHAAMLDTYSGMPSTRYRDLVDLVIIATTQTPQAEPLRQALESEYSHRGLKRPTTVDLPGPSWVNGYAREAKKVANLTHRNADDAVAIVKRFLEPVLSGRATGQWNPSTSRWTESPTSVSSAK